MQRRESPDPPTTATTGVTAHRMQTGELARPAVQEQVQVAVEAPLTIDVQRVDSYTLLCTPADHRALALGFLRTEGIIDCLADVASLEPCQDDPSTLRVRLTNPVPPIGDEGRNLLIVSSCGLCGAESLEHKLAALPSVPNTLRIDCRLLPLISDALRKEQELFRSCGGTHAAGIFDARGQLRHVAEDAGRHNALDKAIGKSLLAGDGGQPTGVALSGRVSLEMVTKCARAGIELISAISAPTSLAIEVAEQTGITLCAFVRETRATAFSHPGRLVTPTL